MLCYKICSYGFDKAMWDSISTGLYGGMTRAARKMRTSVAWRCRCQSYVNLQNLRQPCTVDGRGLHPGCRSAVVCELWALLALVRGLC